MAETNNATGGESTTNTTTGTTGGGATTGGRGTGNTLSNTTTSTSGGTGGGSNLSSANTPDAKLENENAPKAVVEQGSQLPYPHSALTNVKVEATAYRDLISDVYKEHEKAMESDKVEDIVLSPEMLAAREDAQVRLADELRASLTAQRSMQARQSAKTEGAVAIKLSKPHMHGGIAYEAGDEIKVDEISAKFIEDSKVGKRADGSESK